jgi:hypothetical protein
VSSIHALDNSNSVFFNISHLQQHDYSHFLQNLMQEIQADFPQGSLKEKKLSKAVRRLDKYVTSKQNRLRK